jgi:hypothetical protein
MTQKYLICFNPLKYLELTAHPTILKYVVLLIKDCYLLPFHLICMLFLCLMTEH